MSSPDYCLLSSAAINRRGLAVEALGSMFPAAGGRRRFRGKFPREGRPPRGHGGRETVSRS
jgi:hypothetical protein